MMKHLLFAAVIPLAVASANADPIYTKFDVPGAINTVASSINGSGTIAGYYQVPTGKCAGWCGFTRAADGAISTFKIKGCKSDLLITDINTSGELVGNCRSKSSAFSFIRSADGSISRVHRMRGSSPNLYRISDNGIAGGVFFQSGSHPFLRLPDGSKHVLKGAKKMLGEIGDINASGVSTGLISNNPGKAFIYVLGEKIQEFSVPNFYDARGDAINDAGDVAGICQNPNEPLEGFVRNADGTFEVFDLGVQASGDVHAPAMVTVGSDRQVIGFAANDSNFHSFGFIRHESGTLETFDISGNDDPSAGTYAIDANASGTVVGYYADHQDHYHAYIRTP